MNPFPPLPIKSYVYYWALVTSSTMGNPRINILEPPAKWSCDIMLRVLIQCFIWKYRLIPVCRNLYRDQKKLHTICTSGSGPWVLWTCEIHLNLPSAYPIWNNWSALEQNNVLTERVRLWHHSLLVESRPNNIDQLLLATVFPGLTGPASSIESKSQHIWARRKLTGLSWQYVLLFPPLVWPYSSPMVIIGTPCHLWHK